MAAREDVASGEAQVSAYLTAQGLLVERFDKAAMRQGRTPDFRVLAGGRLAFYCEVKTAQEDEWLERQLRNAPPLTLVGGARSDPTYNRVSNQIHSAAGQFESVNPGCEYPNVLAIVNNDFEAGMPDLVAVLTGNAYTENGSVLPWYRNFSEGRIREEKIRIHLYLWFDEGESEPKKFWMQSHAAHHSALCRHLGIDPAQIRQI
ncbi:MAG: hypothetical protein ABSD27_09225 [Bryobacteraceae bacterium]